jgi:hypothetical protein
MNTRKNLKLLANSLTLLASGSQIFQCPQNLPMQNAGKGEGTRLLRREYISMLSVSSLVPCPGVRASSAPCPLIMLSCLKRVIVRKWIEKKNTTIHTYRSYIEGVEMVEMVEVSLLLSRYLVS